MIVSPSSPPPAIFGDVPLGGAFLEAGIEYIKVNHATVSAVRLSDGAPWAFAPSDPVIYAPDASVVMFP
jgi:hypothetical protein